jgi:hypothetical protein
MIERTIDSLVNLAPWIVTVWTANDGEIPTAYMPEAKAAIRPTARIWTQEKDRETRLVGGRLTWPERRGGRLALVTAGPASRR